MSLRKQARWATTFIPSPLAEARWAAQRSWLRLSMRPHEDDFRALGVLLTDRGHRSPVCVDVGANRGQSIESMRLCLGPVPIIAFEPQEHLALKLAQRYARATAHYPSVLVQQYALGAAPGWSKLYVPSYRGFRFDGLASSSETLAREWFSYAMWRYDERLVSVEVIEVMVTTLDTQVSQADFIKLDVQGAELDVLKGATDLLETRPLLMIEAPDSTIHEYLSGYGYQPWHWDDDLHKAVPGPGPITGNTFFR
jgi:FkbM family methyltransferase